MMHAIALNRRLQAGEAVNVVLNAGDLRVELAVASARLEPIYGPRFDRSAQVEQAIRGGRTYLAPSGLPDEFGLWGHGVLGYEAAACPRGEFVKIGVGKLRRDTAEDYSFTRRWPVVAVAPVTVLEVEPDRLVVRQAIEGGKRGYEQIKRYVVGEPFGLRIDYQLTNTGAEPYEFEHYNHNFLQFDGQPSGPGYRVGAAFALPAEAGAGWRFVESGVRLREEVGTTRRRAWAFSPAAPAGMNRVKVEHRNGQGLEITGDFPVARFALWASGEAICPEVFHRSRVGVGEVARWSRTYRFD